MWLTNMGMMHERNCALNEHAYIKLRDLNLMHKYYKFASCFVQEKYDKSCVFNFLDKIYFSNNILRSSMCHVIHLHSSL